jgi:outer membrane protein assembly factor BamB
MNPALAAFLALTAALWTVQADHENISIDHHGLVTLAPTTTRLTAFDENAVWDIQETRSGDIWVATGSSGRLYRLDRNGTLHTAYDAGAGEILALTLDPSNHETLIFGLSPQGTIHRTTANGPVTQLCATDQEYVFGLLPGPNGEIWAATGPNGHLYRIRPDGTRNLIYTAPQAHLTTLAWLNPGTDLLIGTSPDGIVYRLALAPGNKPPGVAVLYDTPLDEIRALALLTPHSSVQTPIIYLAANPGEDDTAEDAISTIYAVQPDGITTWQWQLEESTIYDILTDDTGLIVATDDDGTIYRLDPHGHPTTLQQLEPNRTICIARHSPFDTRQSSFLIGTSQPAELYRLIPGYSPTGQYVSDPHDCEGPATFGRIQPRATVPAGTELHLDTRSGNSEQPDSTWTEWQKPPSPSARYVQWRARFGTRFDDLTPELQRVDLYYTIPNRPPHITSFELGAGNEKDVPGICELTWETEDLDHDSLSYTLLYKADNEQDWKQLKTDIAETTWQLDTRALPDAWYEFKLIATDQPDRPDETARTHESTSLPLSIDNTPPTVSRIRLAADHVRFRATDASSPLGAARISVNAGPWRPARPDDGIFDELGESFTSPVELRPGENIIAIRVTDTQDNTTTARKIVNR